MFPLHSLKEKEKGEGRKKQTENKCLKIRKHKGIFKNKKTSSNITSTLKHPNNRKR